MNVVMLTTAKADKAQAEYEAASAALLARVEALQAQRWRLGLAIAVARAQATTLDMRHSGTTAVWPYAARAGQ